jgi:hypothetical protein
MELLGGEALFAEMVAGLGAALLVGNAVAGFRHKRGLMPKDQEGAFRPGRAVFLASVGALMVIWGVATFVSL